MDFTRTGDPFLLSDEEFEQPTPLSRVIAECAARPGGHAWEVEGIPEETPFLWCADCPVRPDDLFPDIMDELDTKAYEIGGRTVTFGAYLPGIQSNRFTIPVDVAVRISPPKPDYWSGDDHVDIEILITDRAEATAR